MGSNLRYRHGVVQRERTQRKGDPDLTQDESSAKERENDESIEIPKLQQNTREGSKKGKQGPKNKTHRK